MAVQPQLRKEAMGALCRRDGYNHLHSMFERKLLGKDFAVAEMRRSMYVFERHFMVEKLRLAAGIAKAEEREIAKKLCFGLLKSAEFYMKKGEPGSAMGVCRKIEDIVCDYGLHHDKDFWVKYHTLHVAANDQLIARQKNQEAGNKPG